MRWASFYRQPCMSKTKKTKQKYLFKHTCHNCNNDIEFPLWGMFDDTEVYLQTTDGKDFFLGDIVDNKSFWLVDTFLQDKGFELSIRRDYTHKILRLLADKVDNKVFSKNYPLCPICQQLQKDYADNERTNVIELDYAYWTGFESLDKESKLKKIQEIMNHLTN
jgi:hypothetical protein